VDSDGDKIRQLAYKQAPGPRAVDEDLLRAAIAILRDEPAGSALVRFPESVGTEERKAWAMRVIAQGLRNVREQPNGF
jgi:hypothetical protein